MKLKSYPVTRSLLGTLVIPGDKSISHRSIIISSISKGKTKITNLLESADVFRTISAIKNLGVKIIKKNKKFIVFGHGLHSLKKPNKNFYLGNSGTSARLLSGLLASQSFATKLTGDHSLSKRPMKRIIEPLKEMGSKFISKKNLLPIKIIGNSNLQPINYTLKIPSAQVKSGILIAALYIDGTSKITESNSFILSLS